jgi:hypothetical protein
VAGTGAGASAGFSSAARRQTRPTTTISSFSASGFIRHQLAGSPRYRTWEMTSSGSRLLSSTGRVASQVSTPGGSTYSQNSVWLNGKPSTVRMIT